MLQTGDVLRVMMVASFRNLVCSSWEAAMGDNLMPSEIVDEIRGILSLASRGKGSRSNFLTSFQILNRLSEPTRQRLIRERSMGGAGGGTYSAPNVISTAAQSIPDVVVEYIDTGGLSIDVADQTVRPSNTVCGIYRIEPG
jgi:hypothetical protein